MMATNSVLLLFSCAAAFRAPRAQLLRPEARATLCLQMRGGEARATLCLRMRGGGELPERRLPYAVLGAVSSAAWLATATAALATYKPERVLHNAIGVAEAATAVPVIGAVGATLAGCSARRGVAGRRLHLAWASASAWSAAAVLWAPRLMAAVVRGTSHPASCGRDDFREISGGKTTRNGHRRAW